jgi:hypothetical protein
VSCLPNGEELRPCRPQITVDITERVLYWLSLDIQVRALTERLVGRFAKTVGDLPASADYHHSEPGGLYRHSLEVALKTLEEFEVFALLWIPGIVRGSSATTLGRNLRTTNERHELYRQCPCPPPSFSTTR